MIQPLGCADRFMGVDGDCTHINTPSEHGNMKTHLRRSEENSFCPCGLCACMIYLPQHAAIHRLPLSTLHRCACLPGHYHTLIFTCRASFYMESDVTLMHLRCRKSLCTTIDATLTYFHRRGSSCTTIDATLTYLHCRGSSCTTSDASLTYLHRSGS